MTEREGPSGGGGNVPGELNKSVPSVSPFFKYNFFLKQEDKTVKCNICQAKVNHSQGNTTGMHNHLQKYHETEYKKFQQIKESLSKPVKTKDKFTQLKLNTNNNAITLKFHDKALQERFNRACVKFVAERNLSFLQAEGIGTLVDSLYPPGQAKVKALTRKQIANESTRLYNEVSDNLAEIIEILKSQCGCIAFTSDLWSSPSLESFIGLSLHAIDEKFHFHTFVPFIKLFVGAHTGVNIQVHLEDFLRAVQMEDEKIRKIVVVDSASNNKLALKKTNMMEGFFCQIHILQRAVVTTFNAKIKGTRCDHVLQKCQALTRKLRKAGKYKSELKEVCEEMGLRSSWPVTANSTRWNSVLASLESVVKLKSAFQVLQVRENSVSWEDYLPSGSEWKLIEAIVEILQIPLIVTKKWETDSRPTLHSIVPEVYNMTCQLEKKAKDNGSYLEVFTKTLLNNVKARFPKYGAENQLVACAHYLDPGTHGILLEDVGSLQTTKSRIKELSVKYSTVAQPAQDQSAPVPIEEDEVDVSPMQKLLKRRRLNAPVEVSDEESDILAEMKIYEEMPLSEIDILDFWRENSKKLPLLSRTAREVRKENYL